MKCHVILDRLITAFDGILYKVGGRQIFVNTSGPEFFWMNPLYVMVADVLVEYTLNTPKSACVIYEFIPNLL